MSFDYDLFVIGAGPGGISAARQSAAHGAHVLISERDQVGGTCVIHGCIPEKLMAYAASFSHVFEDADEYGWDKVNDRIDWHKFMIAKDRAIQHLNKLHIQHLQEAGVNLVYGEAKFLDSHTLDVGGRQITASKILIAVGGEAVKPEIPGIEYAITTRQMFEIKQQPEHISIIGSDQIAVKFAGSLNGLISKVTLIVPEDRILPDQDEDIRTTVQEGMMNNGIQVFCNTVVEKIEKVQDCLRLSLLGNKQDTITVNTVICAIGRVPNLSGLDLEKAGVQVKQGAIPVDEYSCTNQSNIFAVGDCTNRPHWTPVAIATGRAFADTVFGNKPRTVNLECIPSALSSQPEAATVGLTEAEAREKFGESIRCYSQRFQPLFDTIAEPEQKTLIKLVVDSKSDRVIGAHMVGEYAAEIIQCLGLAIRTGITKKDFDATIGIHPSAAEEFFSLR
ncbi:glutathione-disulfide reductase (plasmid) [Nostoc cf. commune SO-36]|uniref:Glutathione-disulfide reductase n=1 Tax=Nostoc cf. commune SO-36 TaxID=449208 RepID=A0ABM7ZBV2_NOSCO|nr:glutathione-disulfide reductase [Nostoc commune]BDI20768.1 glutathione-disulfide reductase [Nostoc cf. commune SO-36]